MGADAGGCQGLECQQVMCPGGGLTTLSGTVWSPNTVLPIYNAIVYVPNGPVLPFPDTVTCDVCGELASAKPLVSALSQADGTFTLTNVPVGTDIPVVIQMGRWRRQFVIPQISACTSNVVPDQYFLRMPANQIEGDIPRIAVSTGELDPIECLLRKIGIDETEFTDSAHPGRIHIYKENGHDLMYPGLPSSALWSSLDQLKKYDIVLLPCEGEERQKPGIATQNMIDYTSAGGRVFATHYSYVWIHLAQPPFPSTAAWHTEKMAPDGIYFTADVDQTFPKGKAFAQWLLGTGASTTMGKITLEAVRRDVDSVYTPPSRAWINGAMPPSTTNNAVLHFTFNTPIPQPGGPVDDAGAPLQCGRVVYSDFHVTVDAAPGSGPIPQACVLNALTPQEKALAFMLFDLSSCVQDDDKEPMAPIQ
jgi:hypothetical protein